MYLTKTKPLAMKFISSTRVAFKFKGIDEEGKEVTTEATFPLSGKGFYPYTLKFMHHGLEANPDGWVDFKKLTELELNITVTEKTVNDKKYIEILY